MKQGECKSVDGGAQYLKFSILLSFSCDVSF